MLTHKLVLAISALSLGGVAQMPPHILKAAAPSRPARLEGMAYLPARRIILSHGWRPAPGPCWGILPVGVCASFPEIAACSCCQRVPCAMQFTRRNRCLHVMTEGAAPEPGVEEGDAHVVYVGFRRGHCSKPR
jgi:hypothetical protein